MTNTNKTDNTKMEIEIDGKKLEVNPNETIIEVADRENIKIPRFCYHDKLSIASNCRMCLVEVSNAIKSSFNRKEIMDSMSKTEVSSLRDKIQMIENDFASNSFIFQ